MKKTPSYRCRGEIRAETESKIIAAQGHALQTEYRLTRLTNRDSMCRACQQFDETIDHILSTFPILAEEEYISRHDSVCAQLHFKVCKEMG